MNLCERKVVVEVSGCAPEKLQSLRLKYGDNNVFHISYDEEEIASMLEVLM